MNGTLAQYIALALHGSVWLADRAHNTPPTLELNSTFQYVGGLRFITQSPSYVTSDVASWLAHLGQRGVRRLHLSVPDFANEPDDPGFPWHDRAGFVGGLPIALYADTDSGGERWTADWHVGDEGSSRIWWVTYCGERTPDRPHTPAVADAHAELTAAIKAAAAFAKAHGLQPWAGVFTLSLALGGADEPEPPYHPDMLPDRGVRLASRRLLAMATGANVFGAMGTWNDNGFDDEAVQEEFAVISRRLFAAVMSGFAAAVNAPLEA